MNFISKETVGKFPWEESGWLRLIGDLTVFKIMKLEPIQKDSIEWLVLELKLNCLMMFSNNRPTICGRSILF